MLQICIGHKTATDDHRSKVPTLSQSTKQEMRENLCFDHFEVGPTLSVQTRILFRSTVHARLRALEDQIWILNPSLSWIQIWILNPTLIKNKGLAHMKFVSRILACLKCEYLISGPLRGLNNESLTSSSSALDLCHSSDSDRETVTMLQFLMGHDVTSSPRSDLPQDWRSSRATSRQKVCQTDHAQWWGGDWMLFNLRPEWALKKLLYFSVGHFGTKFFEGQRGGSNILQ